MAGDHYHEMMASSPHYPDNQRGTMGAVTGDGLKLSPKAPGLHDQEADTGTAHEKRRPEQLAAV